MENILEVRNLSKNEILKNITFNIRPKEMVAIMGPSGSGKSTLLYQVSGMDHPTGGEIILNGTNIVGLKEDELAKLRLTKMGFVFQQMNMIKNLSVIDNVLLPAYHVCKNKKERNEAKEKALKLFEKMGIQDLAERKINEVSGGQLQRACICRSLMNDPEILFADEPTGALNQASTNEVMDEFVRLNQENVTILMVTHDSKVASRCSRILFIVDGGIKGELMLEGDITNRLEKVSTWLKDMGW